MSLNPSSKGSLTDPAVHYNARPMGNSLHRPLNPRRFACLLISIAAVARLLHATPRFGQS
jgi:hypothetical protein